MERVISVKGLTKTYGDVKAVDDLTLDVYKGEIFGLLGHNGAGKTTSIECILGTKIPEQGKIEVLGMNPLQNRKKLFQRVGVQFQQSNYQERIKVKEICEVTHSLYEDPLDWKDLVDSFGLGNFKNQTVSELSGGERQRLSILLALIPNPELIFLDELTTGLDPKARRDVWKNLESLKEKGLSIFLTSHYMDEVKALCDRICILKKGKIQVIDTVDNIIETSLYDNLEEAYLWYSGEGDAI